MRSCLVLLGVLILAAVLVLWFAVPAVAGVLAVNALRAAGLSGTNIQVQVEASPPPRLLLGHADSVHLMCTDAAIRDLHAGAIDVTLSDVSLLTRDVGAVDGSFDDVIVSAPDGTAASFTHVELHGVATAASAELTLPLSEATRLAEARLLSVWGLTGTVALVAPNRVLYTAAGRTEGGTLLVRDGGLYVAPDLAALGEAGLFEPGDGNPFTITGAEILGSDLRLSGTIDVQSLLAGA